jgi:hypothetical protein
MNARTIWTRVVTALFVLMTSSILADTVTATGKLVSIDEATRMISVKRKTSRGEKTGEFVVSKKASISISGEFADLDELEPEQIVTLTYDTISKEVVVIKAESDETPNKTNPASDKSPNEAIKAKKPAQKITLFNGTDLSGWTIEAQPGKGTDDWSVDPVEHLLKCNPMPKGPMDYITTEGTYDNFKLSLDYRFPPGGHASNSGSGVAIRSPGRYSNPYLPRGIEIQIAHGTTGDFWAIGSPLTSPKGKAIGEEAKLLERSNGNEKPVGDWNHLEITCKGDQIIVILNGKQVNKGRGARAIKGHICLLNQSTSIEFKDIVLLPLEE